jgi:hypothetical protein
LDADMTRQVVWREAPVVLPVTEITANCAQERVSEAQALIRSEAQRPFDLSMPPLMRAGLIRFTDSDHVLFFTMHHIVSDLWSMKLFLRELTEFYNSGVDQRDPELPALSMQYSDYVAWQRSYLQGSTLDEHLAYWRSQLRGTRDPELQGDLRPADVRSNQGGVLSRVIGEDLVRRTLRLAKQNRVTLFMTLLCAFQMLVSYYTGEDDIVVSSLIANRNQLQLERLIGVFSNRLPFRINFVGKPSFREALDRMRDVCLGAYQHQLLSLWKVFELAPDVNDSKGAGLLFALQDVPSPRVAFNGLQLEGFECTGISMFEGIGMTVTGRYEQSWEIWKDARGTLRVVVSYRSDRFSSSAVDKMICDYVRTLDTLVSNPDSPAPSPELACTAAALTENTGSNRSHSAHLT